VTETRHLDAAGFADAPDVLPGDLVRDLVTRNEDEIETLLARLAELEAQAEEAELAVRRHPGLALVAPDVAERLLPLPQALDVEPGAGRPRTTVVTRGAQARSDTGQAGATTAPGPASPVTGESKGVLGRLTTSHWWWRIGIVLVLVALVLLKVG
jgi:hypothetical protein